MMKSLSVLFAVAACSGCLALGGESVCDREEFYKKVISGDESQVVVLRCGGFLQSQLAEQGEILRWVVSLGDVSLLEQLLRIGYSVREAEAMLPSSLLFEAVGARHNRSEMFRFLINQGVTVAEAKVPKHSLYYYSLESGDKSLIEAVKAVMGDSLVVSDSINLFAAVSANDLGSVVELLSGGADPNVVDGEGNTPLVAAIVSRSSFAISQELIKSGADCSRRNRYGDNAISLVENNEELKKILRKCVP